MSDFLYGDDSLTLGEAKVASSQAAPGALGARKVVGIVLATLAAVAVIGVGAYFAWKMFLKNDSVVGTWSYATIELESSADELTAEQLETFEGARSLAALAMQGLYLTLDEDGTGSVEFLDKAIGATWQATGDGAYEIKLQESLEPLGEMSASYGVNINAYTLYAHLTETGRLNVENEPGDDAGPGFESHAVFQRIDPQDKVSNALFDAMTELDESVLVDSARPHEEQQVKTDE